MAFQLDESTAHLQSNRIITQGRGASHGEGKPWIFILPPEATSTPWAQTKTTDDPLPETREAVVLASPHMCTPHELQLRSLELQQARRLVEIDGVIRLTAHVVAPREDARTGHPPARLPFSSAVVSRKAARGRAWLLGVCGVRACVCRFLFPSSCSCTMEGWISAREVSELTCEHLWAGSRIMLPTSREARKHTHADEGKGTF